MEEKALHLGIVYGAAGGRQLVELELWPPGCEQRVQKIWEEEMGKGEPRLQGRISLVGPGGRGQGMGDKGQELSLTTCPLHPPLPVYYVPY